MRFQVPGIAGAGGRRPPKGQRGATGTATEHGGDAATDGRIVCSKSPFLLAFSTLVVS